ncbi:MAG: hypothetical protein AMJ53_12195 [Gammaproteobacteria bacterium SG8_11]|nr:MAG: hypothetical protein AMJ53_12195 [Gammaproteobacteria bacterium SG8_11]
MTTNSNSSPVELTSIKPMYGENYNEGYIGFTYYKTNFVCNGIAYFTRWSRVSDIKVSHALIVTGENQCVEATFTKGVVQSDLAHYFDDPTCQIFFKKPNGLTKAIADKIVELAKKEVGTEYDTRLIASQALQGSHIGKLINSIFNGSPDRIVSKLLNNDNCWICSELVAYCLDEQLEYKNKGILSKPNETIDPQELFEDQVIFKAWKSALPSSTL